MIGEPVKAVEDGVQTLVRSLRGNPYALETAWLSVITFASKARVASKLADISQFQTPILSVKPGTSLGAALTLLRECLAKDIVRTKADTKGDYRPIVFLLTDGQPTDEWLKPAELLSREGSGRPIFYCIGCGDEVDFDTLGKISPNCISVKDLDAGALDKVFVWLSSSIGSFSASPENEPVSLVKMDLAPGLEVVDLSKPPSFNSNNMFYLHGVCSSTKRNYLYSYRLNKEDNLYKIKGCHPLPDDFFSDGSFPSPKIDFSKLIGALPCPHCGNQSFFHCGSCGSINCMPTTPNGNYVTCIVCGVGGNLATQFREISGSIG
jgi:uncharacterized protein YegL